MRKLFGALILGAFLTIPSLAQDAAITAGYQQRFGGYGVRNVPNGNLADASSYGVFAEPSIKFAQGYLTGRSLFSVDRVVPEYGASTTRFHARPELELALSLNDKVSFVSAAGFQYENTDASATFNPTLGAGVKAGDFKVTVARVFPESREKGSLRAVRTRFDYTKPAVFGDSVGLAVSVEYDAARSELPYVKSHPGYSGYVVGARIGFTFGK